MLIIVLNSESSSEGGGGGSIFVALTVLTFSNHTFRNIIINLFIFESTASYLWIYYQYTNGISPLQVLRVHIISPTYGITIVRQVILYRSQLLIISVSFDIYALVCAVLFRYVLYYSCTCCIIQEFAVLFRYVLYYSGTCSTSVLVINFDVCGVLDSVVWCGMMGCGMWRDVTWRDGIGW